MRTLHQNPKQSSDCFDSYAPNDANAAFVCIIRDCEAQGAEQLRLEVNNSRENSERYTMNNIDIAVNQFIEAIKESDTYGEYMRQLEKVKQQPELKKQIDDYRARNYQLQTSGEIRFDKIDQFEREYEGFRENAYVSDFLAAELAFCRMMQEMNIRIVEAMNFE